MPDEIMLNYLGGGYFHQDFDLEAESPSALVAQFAEEDSIDYVRIFSNEMTQIIAAGLTEDQARVLWIDDANAMYDPADDGISYLDWLTEVLRIVDEELAKRVDED